MLWANLHLLFWLSLLPFGTAWMGEHEFAAVPVAVYGVILLAAAIAYFILVRALLRIRPTAPLAQAIGSDAKGKISPVLYAVAIPVALVAPLDRDRDLHGDGVRLDRARPPHRANPRPLTVRRISGSARSAAGHRSCPPRPN